MDEILTSTKFNDNQKGFLFWYRGGNLGPKTKLGGGKCLSGAATDRYILYFVLG